MNTQAMSTTAPSLSAASRLRDGDFANAVRRHRMMVFLRRPPPGTTEPMVQAVAEAGVNIVEFTLDGTDTLASIRRWRDSAVPFVGAGTCRTTDDMDAAADAGAQFIVTPGYRPHVVDKALSINMPCIIGAMTATEIESAWDDGATFVKLFPGAYLGPKYLRTILTPLREIEIVVTGGVDAADATEFITAGAAAVGVSIAQLGPPPERESDFSIYGAEAAKILELIGGVTRPF
jgi:2-dehydro-3-deoxyphosphogluconate aldolase/(4S)-4-hydroxy-2-oxoglutarate aldolase